MDFLEFALRRGEEIDEEFTRFVESYKRESTARQYNSSFKKFVAFLHDVRLTRMTKNLAIAFFKSLHDRGLVHTTIATIKSSLRKIFWYGFQIDLNNDLFSSIPRACAMLNPRDPPSEISWSLNKVLSFASELDHSSVSYTLLLRKTLFLLALASGARLSEVSTLSRDEGHVSFLPSGEVDLRPHPRFLAKNEDPARRWQPWRIVPLPQFPSLCPVSALRAYLDRTSSLTSGRLFVREEGGTLTTDGVRQQILYFIKTADPGSVPKGQETRKVATSVNFFHHMVFDDLCKYTGWKSQRVFHRHYLRNIEDLRLPTVAAGKVVVPKQ